MLEVELYKLVDAGHFWCKPHSRNKKQAEQYYTLIGKINDYCSKTYDQASNQRSSIPNKGQVCLVKRTSDRCWYRARILSVFQTTSGPQARVLLVDLGERTLVPGLWIQEIPEDFISIPFQTIECVLAGLKPITLVTSYFDLTTTKQPGDTWDVAATEWFRKGIEGCSLQMDVKHIDEDGVHHVLLFATGAAGMVCLNDELVNKDFAILSKTIAGLTQDQNMSSSKKNEHSQDLFLQEHKEVIQQLNSSVVPDWNRSESSDSIRSTSMTTGIHQRSKMKYQPITGSGDYSFHEFPKNDIDQSSDAQHSGLSSDEDTGRVRFLSARLPATGASSLLDASTGVKTKQSRPILKMSSGYSSSEQEDVLQNMNSGARLPRQNLSSAQLSSARSNNTANFISQNGQRRTTDASQGQITRKYEQNTTSTFSSTQLFSSSSVPSMSPNASSLSQLMLKSQHPDSRTSSYPCLSPRVPTIHLRSPHTPSSPPEYPHVPSSSYSTHNNTSQYPAIPTSPSKSLHTSTPDLPVSPSQSPCVPTPSPSQSPRVPASPLPCSRLCHLSKDVFIHGEGLPQPITQIDSSIFSETLMRALRDMGVTSPSSFQSNVWPAILRGRDVCGIPGTDKNSSLSYLLPVVAQIAEPGVYSELPLGNGALALVLCSDWRRVELVYDSCHKLTKNVRNIRVQVLYAAGHEDEHILNLINGCEIIIATVPCFLRMLKRGYTRLDRLCHLVFDEADILAEERTECIKNLMREYGSLLASQPNRLAPRQCVALASKWTPGVCSLVKAYLGNPLIIISNHVESAMFCKVRHAMQFESSKKRDSQLIGFLDSLTTNVDHEIIIFTSAAKDAERLSELLEYYSYSVLLAHEFMTPDHLTQIRRQWNTPHSSQSYPVVVMTDGVIDKCNIRNSSCVIHYNFPANKTLYGKRLFCMAASYPSTKEKECLSVIFGTESESWCLQSMVELVTRAGGEIPSIVNSLVDIVTEDQEKKKKKLDLCKCLKAFGVCKSSVRCKERHTVFADVDVSTLLPRSGIVKVLVLRVWDASHYYVRILEHKSDSKTACDQSSNYYSGATFLKLALDLNAWYAVTTNRHLCAIITPHKLCVVENEGSYYRVKLVRVVKEDPETQRALEVEAYFVDRGYYKDVSTRHLLEIATQFADIPFQAVEAFVGRVKPVDDEKAWTNKADRFVKQHIEGKELEGRVIMGLRNTIWLDPLVAKTHLKEINVLTNTFNVRLDLLKEGLAARNPEHFDNLRKHFELFVTMQQLTGQENSERSLNFPPLVETATLPDEGYTMVKVPAVVNPGLFYVRQDENTDRLAAVEDQITERMKKPSCYNEKDLIIGSLCVARFTEDNQWYRAKIFSIRPEGEYDVFFVDYGDREWVPKDRIVPAWPEILELPFQAIECSLANISPLEKEWTKDDGDFLWDITGEKLLYVKVKSKSTAMFAGTCCYAIELCDTSSDRDISLNHEMVLAGHAQATLEFHKTLFPEAFQASNSGRQKEHFEDIPEICLRIYKSQDSNMKIRLAKEIKNIVSESYRQNDALRESGGIRCICRLLGVSKIETVQEFIVITLAILASRDEQNSDEIRREGGLKALCYLLTKTKSAKIQEHTAWALKNLATNDRNRDEVRELKGVSNLCLLLRTTDNEKVQENICWAIVALCADNNKNCDAVREAGGLDTLFSLLKSASDDCVLENVMWAISVLACNCNNKKMIGEQGGIVTICNLIKSNQNEKIFKNAVRSLKTLSSYNDENREMMCRLGVIDVMRRLTEVAHVLPFDTRRLCLDLIQRLLGRAPDVPLIEASSSITSSVQEPIRCKPICVTKKKRKSINENSGVNEMINDSDDDLPPLEDTAELSTPAVHPMVMWSQTKRYVRLSIKLRGVAEKLTRITEETFYFRTKHQGKLYELNLTFFAGILPKECAVHVRGSEVLVNLKKSEPSRWQRLLASPEKLPYLGVDFDRWDTDSSNEDDMTVPRVRVPLTKTSKTNKLDYTMPPEDRNESQGDTTDEEGDIPEQFFDFS